MRVRLCVSLLLFHISPVFIFLEQPLEKEKVKKAADHCRQILNFVNQAVKEAENKQVRRGRCNSVFKN